MYFAGTLSVNGDPSDTGGNISLKLQEKNAAIGIVPGTKNITLLRPLDREEKQGPSNVYVNVRCDRRRTTDPVRMKQHLVLFLSVRRHNLKVTKNFGCLVIFVLLYIHFI